MSYQFSRRNDYGFNPRQSFGQSRSNQSGFYNSYRPAGNSAQPKKHTGAKCGIGKNKKPYISAWNYSRRHGLVKVFIAPYKGTYKQGLFSGGVNWHQSQNGRVYQVWMAKVEGVGFSEIIPVLVNEQGSKATIKKYGWVVNCGARNGGYCGTFTKK